MAVYIILRAAFGYLFLVFLTRILGRRPGRQLTPFEFVLIFYLGGLMLTGIVGRQESLTNAVCQIITIATCHYVLSYLRMRSARVAHLLDGTPLLLLAGGRWRSRTMSHMRLQDDDIMDMAREQGIRDLSSIGAAVLETYGQITILPADAVKQSPNGPGKAE